MKIFVCITNEKGNKFSHMKQSSPKMLNSLVDLCITYENIFKEKYKISRFIQTPKGFKKC